MFYVILLHQLTTWSKNMVENNDVCQWMYRPNVPCFASVSAEVCICGLYMTSTFCIMVYSGCSLVIHVVANTSGKLQYFLKPIQTTPWTSSLLIWCNCIPETGKKQPLKESSPKNVRGLFLKKCLILTKMPIIS